jgi:hypothetical protein
MATRESLGANVTGLDDKANCSVGDASVNSPVDNGAYFESLSLASRLDAKPIEFPTSIDEIHMSLDADVAQRKSNDAAQSAAWEKDGITSTSKSSAKYTEEAFEDNQNVQNPHTFGSTSPSDVEDNTRGRKEKQSAIRTIDDSAKRTGPLPLPEPQVRKDIVENGASTRASWTYDHNNLSNATSYMQHFTHGSRAQLNSHLSRAITLPDYYSAHPEPNVSYIRTESPSTYSRRAQRNGVDFGHLKESRAALSKPASASAPSQLPSPVPSVSLEYPFPGSQGRRVAIPPTSLVRLTSKSQTHVPFHGGIEVQPEQLAFSVPVQCSHATLHSRFSTTLHQHWPERQAENDFGKAWVRKAVSSKRFKKRDGLHSIELTCHTGPTPIDTNDYHIQWLYVSMYG